jgi:hypothetical protein
MVEVPFDCTGGEEEPRADLGVRESVSGEAGDLGLLGSKVGAGLVNPFAGTLAGGRELALGAPGEGVMPIA